MNTSRLMESAEPGESRGERGRDMERELRKVTKASKSPPLKGCCEQRIGHNARTDQRAARGGTKRGASKKGQKAAMGGSKR